MDHRYTSDRDILYDREMLQAFVQGSLDAKKMQEIAEAAKDSEALAIRIEGMRLLLDEGGEEGLNDFMAESWAQQEGLIGDFVRKEVAESAPQRTPFLTYAVAAGIALLLGLGAFLLNRMNGGSDLLEEALAESFPLIQAQIVRSNPVDKENWEEAYEKEDFAAVVQELAAKPDKKEAENFYLGMAHLQQGQYQEAIETYRQVIAMDNLKGFLEQARWFASLAHTQLNQIPEARALWDTILQKEGHYKQAEAKKLRDRYPLPQAHSDRANRDLIKAGEKRMG